MGSFCIRTDLTFNFEWGCFDQIWKLGRACFDFIKGIKSDGWVMGGHLHGNGKNDSSLFSPYEKNPKNLMVTCRSLLLTLNPPLIKAPFLLFLRFL